MGDPFSAENIALFERQANGLSRPPLAHLPHRQDLSDTTEETSLGDVPANSHDVEAQQNVATANESSCLTEKQEPKAFKFVVS